MYFFFNVNYLMRDHIVSVILVLFPLAVILFYFFIMSFELEKGKGENWAKSTKFDAKVIVLLQILT